MTEGECRYLSRVKRIFSYLGISQFSNSWKVAKSLSNGNGGYLNLKFSSRQD